MNFENAQSSVSDFHRLIGAPIADEPQLLSSNKDKAGQAVQLLTETLNSIQSIAADDALLMRLCMQLEETIEWIEAHQNDDLVEAADALGDRAYLLLGDAVSTGIPLEKVFDEVHRSNMTKKGGMKSGDGKGIKSEGFEEPDLGFVIS